MSDQKREMFTRRKMIAGMAGFALGGVVGRSTGVAAEEPIVVPDVPPLPGQIKVKTKSPLCHTSVSSWTLAAGAEVTSQEKIERCSKVCGEVVYTVVFALNEYFAGRWTPPVWTPSEQIKHCVECHTI